MFFTIPGFAFDKISVFMRKIRFNNQIDSKIRLKNLNRPLPLLNSASISFSRFHRQFYQLMELFNVNFLQKLAIWTLTLSKKFSNCGRVQFQVTPTRGHVNFQPKIFKNHSLNVFQWFFLVFSLNFS